MLGTICNDTKNMFNMQHMTSNLSEWVIKFDGLFWDNGHQGLCSP